MSAKALRAACADARLRRPRTLPAVVDCLGRHYTAGLVNRCAAAEILCDADDALRNRAQQAWQRALRVSTISYLLAILDGRFDPEEAALAGLLHNLGEFALIGRASREQRADIEEELNVALLHYAGEAGRELARSWGFPASLQRVCNGLNDWYRAHDGDADLADLVIVAQRHARLGCQQAGRLPPLARVPAFAKLDLGHASPRFSLQLLEAANNALALIQRQLHNT
jgi:HD-like signal output (HDOD) protein